MQRPSRTSTGADTAKKKDAEAPAGEAAAPAEKTSQWEAAEKALAAGKESPAEGVP